MRLHFWRPKLVNTTKQLTRSLARREDTTSNRDDMINGVYNWTLPNEFRPDSTQADQAMRTDAVAHRFTRRWALDTLDQWFELKPKSLDDLIQPYLRKMNARNAFIDAWTYCRGDATGYLFKSYQEPDLGLGQAQLKYKVTRGIPIKLIAYSRNSVVANLVNRTYPRGTTESKFEFKINGTVVHPSRIIQMFWWKPDSASLAADEGASALNVIWQDVVRNNRIFESYTHNAARWGPGLMTVGIDTNDAAEFATIDDILGPLTAKGRLYYKKDQWEVGYIGPTGKMIPLADIVTPVKERFCTGMKSPQSTLIGSPQGNVEGGELDSSSETMSQADDLLMLEIYLAQLISEIQNALGERSEFTFEWKFIEDLLPRMKTELFYKRAVALDYINKSAFTFNEGRHFANFLFQDMGMHFDDVPGGNIIPRMKELMTESDKIALQEKQQQQQAELQKQTQQNNAWKTPEMKAAEARHHKSIEDLIVTLSADDLGIDTRTKKRWEEKIENHKGGDK